MGLPEWIFALVLKKDVLPIIFLGFRKTSGFEITFIKELDRQTTRFAKNIDLDVLFITLIMIY